VSLKPPDWQEQLQASLRRAQEAMARGIRQQEQIFQSSIESLRASYPNWGQERWQRRLERKLRKQAEREAKIANATLMEGYLWTIGAIALILVALTSLPFLWWLLFPAVPLFQRGVRVISRFMKQPEQQQAAPPVPEAPRVEAVPAPPVRTRVPPPPVVVPAVPEDPRDARVDHICDRLLAELKTAPQSARDIFRNPEQTVASLRQTCRDLTRRERELRAFLAPAEDARLTKEREALQARVDAEADEVAKLRLASALGALDQQRQQRQELAKSANRFEAEHTRIAYTLESLHTQVVRMRSADAASIDVAGAGLRQGLDNLSHEVDALAEALEKVNRGDEGLHALAQPPLDVPGAAPAVREKA